MRQVTKDSTNISVDVYIIDSTDGTPELGVLWNTSGIDLEYRREGEAAVNITEATLAALTTAHTDGGFLEIGHGYYRLDVPDAAFATGAKTVSIQGTVTGMIVLPQTIQLVDFDTEDSVRLGLTALPNAPADGAGGLPISDAGGLDLDTKLANTNEITVARMGALTDWIDGGRLDLILDAINVIAADWTDGGRLDLIIDALATTADLLDKIGAVDEAAAAGDPSATKSVMQYVKQIVNILVGTTGVTTFPAEQSPANNINLAEVIRAIHADVTGLNGDAMRGTDNAVLATSLTTHDTDVKALLPVALVGGRMDSDIGAKTGNVALSPQEKLDVNTEADTALTDYDPPTKAEMDTAHALLATPAQVNTEVVDALNVDTYAEPAQGAPAATTSLADKIGFLYKAWRNRSNQTATTYQLFNDDATTVDHKATVSDDATTAEKGEVETGP